MDMRLFRRVGSDVRVYGKAQIIGPENISVGSHVVIDDFVFLGQHRDVSIGDYVHLASHASLTGGGVLTLGAFCGVSSGARILSGSDDFLGGGLTGPTIPDAYRAVHRGFVTLGRFCIIGLNSVVLPDISVGEGAVVGAGSVVTRDLEPWTVYVGSPARAVRARPKETVLRYAEALLSSTSYKRVADCVGDAL